MANGNYIPGTYLCDRSITVYKNLSCQSRVDANGRIEQTYGTWSTDADNIIVFHKGEKKQLTAMDLEVKGIRSLIDEGILVRTL